MDQNSQKMALWHRHIWIATATVFSGVVGHASREFVPVLGGLAGPETSVWRFTLGGAGLVVVALWLPESRDLLTPLRKHGLRITGLAKLSVTIAYLAFNWSPDFVSATGIKRRHGSTNSWA